MILWIDSFCEVLCECPFQHAAMTPTLLLWTVTSQSCIDLLQSQITVSSMAMHSAQPIWQPLHFQPGRSIHMAHALHTRRPMPQDVEASIQKLRSIIVKGVSECEMFGCDRTSCHHKSWLQAGLGRLCFT